MENENTRRGFTLIELLVVVLIIGILATVAVPQYKKAVIKSRYVQLLVAGDALVKSYNLYRLTNGKNPTTMEELDIIPSGNIQDDDKKRIKNEKIECFFAYSTEMLCKSDYSNVPTWVYYFPTVTTSEYQGIRVCRSYNELEEKVCLSVGGIKAKTQISSNYTHYILP